MTFDMMSSFQRWFTRELSAAIPAPIKAMVTGRALSKPLFFRSGLDRVQITSKAILAPEILLREAPRIAAVNERIEADVYAPKTFFLKREIRLPKAGLKSRGAMCALDLRRQTPFEPEEIYWTESPPKLSGDQAAISQWVVKREAVEALRTRLSAQGVIMRRLLVADAELDAPLISFEGAGSKTERAFRIINFTAATAALLFFLASWLIPAWKNHRALEAVEERLTELRAEAVSRRQEVETRRAAEDQLANFLDVIWGRPILVNTLRSLTVSLPDEVWISDLTYRNGRVLVSGITGTSAPALVLSLTQAKSFHNPRLSGPVSRTAEGNERFELAFDLEQAE